MSLDETFLLALLKALEESGLDALIVGTTAAALHGAPVMTQDVDILVRDTPKNRAKLERLRTVLGAAPPIEVSPLTTTVTLLGAEIPIDVLFDRLPGNLSFASLKSRSEVLRLGAQKARVASLEDVIKSKEASDRPKDRATLPILRETLQVRRSLRAKK